MSIELDPVELGFKRPFTREVAETLRIRNPTSDPIIFKVKTTAPKKYAVRPNSGRVEAGEVVEVQVLLQAMKDDPPESEKCRDKFLVQSVSVAANQEFSSVTAIWSNIESTAKSSIQEKKIRVNWLSSDGSSSGAVFTPARHSTHHDSTLPPYSSPAIGGTPQSQLSSTPAGAVDSITHRSLSEKNSVDVKSESGSTATNEAQSTISAAISSVTNVLPASFTSAVSTSSDELKNQLAEAKATIERLTKQVQDQGLRQRKTEAVSKDASDRIASGTTGQGIQQATATGVPVPITAALCLLSFLLAYLLF